MAPPKTVAGAIGEECIVCRQSGAKQKDLPSEDMKRHHSLNVHGPQHKKVKKLKEKKLIRNIYHCKSCQMGFAFPSGLRQHLKDFPGHKAGDVDAKIRPNVSWASAQAIPSILQIFFGWDGVDFFARQPLKGNEDLAKGTGKDKLVDKAAAAGKGAAAAGAGPTGLGRGAEMRKDVDRAAGAQPPESPSMPIVLAEMDRALNQLERGGLLDGLLERVDHANEEDLLTGFGGAGDPPIGDFHGLCHWLPVVKDAFDMEKEWTQTPTRMESLSLYEAISIVQVKYYNSVTSKIPS